MPPMALPKRSKRQLGATDRGGRRGQGRCFALLALCLWSAACGGGSPPVEPVRIGLIVPLTSPFPASVGEPAWIAALMAVEEVNAQGGLWIDGQRRPVELLVEDSRADPNHAVDVVRRWIGQNSLVALVGPTLSTTAIPVAEVAESYGLPMLTPAASNPKVIAGKHWVFRVTFGDAGQGWALGYFAVQDVGPRCAVLFDQASDYSRGLAEIFQRAVEDAGGEIVASEGYAKEKDFRAALARIAEGAPDVLFIPNYIDDIDLQLAQIGEIGLKTQILGSDSWAVGVFKGRPEAASAIRALGWHRALARAEDEAFVAAFEARLGKEPHGTAALTYDTFRILFRALERGGTDPESLRQQLAATEDFEGLTGPISFHGWQGAAGTVWLFQEDASGKPLLKSVDPHGLGLDEATIHQ